MFPAGLPRATHWNSTAAILRYSKKMLLKNIPVHDNVLILNRKRVGSKTDVLFKRLGRKKKERERSVKILMFAVGIYTQEIMTLHAVCSQLIRAAATYFYT